MPQWSKIQKMDDEPLALIFNYCTFSVEINFSKSFILRWFAILNFTHEIVPRLTFTRPKLFTPPFQPSLLIWRVNELKFWFLLECAFFSVLSSLISLNMKFKCKTYLKSTLPFTFSIYYTIQKYYLQIKYNIRRMLIVSLY